MHMSGDDNETMPQLIVQTTLVLLTSAALVFAFQTIHQRRKEVTASSFPTVLLLVIIGWITTEVISDAMGASLGEAGKWTHLAVMTLFAAAVTLQLKRSR